MRGFCFRNRGHANPTASRQARVSTYLRMYTWYTTRRQEAAVRNLNIQNPMVGQAYGSAGLANILFNESSLVPASFTMIIDL